MMGWYSNGGWMNGLGMAIMLLTWGGLIALGVWAVTRLTSGDSAASTNAESARRILDRRLAAGEIDAEQYAETRRVLEGRGVDVTPPRR